MTEVLVFNDGSQLYGCAEEFNGKLAVYIHGKTLADAFAVMNDPNLTVKIISKRNDGEHTFKNYVHLHDITEAGPQFIVATMMKEN